jgi:large subunit ribosomal protein L17
VNGRIETTEAKAKELRPYIEKLVTAGAKSDLASRRNIASKITDKEAVKILVDTIAPRYKDRSGGYTRITKLPARGGDAAKVAIIEFV